MNTVLLAFALSMGSADELPQVPKLPQAPPAVQVAPTRTPMPDPVDTLRVRYERAVSRVLSGAPVLIGVGVKAPAAYVDTYNFPSGFLGMDDGVYDCYLDAGTYTPMMRKRIAPAPVVAAPPPFAGRPVYPYTPAINAPLAGPLSIALPVTTPTAPIRTFAPAAAFRGGTNGCST